MHVFEYANYLLAIKVKLSSTAPSSCFHCFTFKYQTQRTKTNSILPYYKYFPTLNEGKKGERIYKKKADVNLIYIIYIYTYTLNQPNQEGKLYAMIK